MAEEFYFQWQNSFLRDTIYPRREVKLIDFLVYYKEIELWSEYKDRDIRAKIEEYHNRKKLAVENAVKAYYEHRYYFLKEDVSAEYRQKFATLDKAAMEKIIALHKTFQTYLGKFKDPHSRRFRCAITTSAPGHFVSLFGTGDTGRMLAAEFLAPPWEMHERYWRASPLAFADHMRAPLLLLSGDDDRRCPSAQAEELFAALALRQRDVEWVSFAGAAHDFDRQGRPLAWLERLRRMLDWLQRKL